MGVPNSPLFILVLLVGALIGVNSTCSSTSYVDSYTNLPNAPVFPTTALSGSFTPAVSTANPLTQNHWSEVANLGAYRPPKITPVAQPTQTNCPHLDSTLNLKNWHDPATWGSSGIPSTNGQAVNIPANTAVLVASCSIDPTIVFGTITIPATSKLIFGDANINISATGFYVMGSLLAGNQNCRLRNKITITLYGSRGAQALPADPWVKGIGVTGTIDLHGNQYFPTWTRLAMTAKINDTIIFVQDLVNWQPGQTIVITTTELKDSRDWHRNEQRKIISVKTTTLGSAVAAIELDSPLSYLHFGGKEYQAEVSLLSRDIIVQGDPFNSAPTDTSNLSCKDASDGSTYPCENSYLTGFGAHIIVYTTTAQGRFSGVELTRVGQTNTLGRYPIHYHLMGNQTSFNYQTAFVQDCAVHESYFRCYAIHGTQGVKLTQNTAYNAIGHCYFLEDGVEEENILSYNQAAHVHPLGQYWNPSILANDDSWWAQYLSTYYITSTLLLPSDMAAGCFYITNTYNDFIGNAASGGWAGFSIPSLPLPVKLFANVTNMSPANRPLRSPFRGNSAHSTGYWWATAGGIYVGGELSQPNGVLQYTSGRSSSRDTCSDKTAGTPAGDGGCYTISEQMWLRFEDNKVFLSNRGMQNWGNRAEIIRFELHDVSLAMNVFGQVWIDSMLMECRSTNHRPTFMSGCPSAPAEGGSIGWGLCNVRDYTFFSGFNGFQWYDVGQQHILTNSIFRNCRKDWNRCIYGSTKGICNGVSVFVSLTHSDQFVPELMQVTNNVTYQNVSDLWKYSTALTDATGVTVSGRLQSWYDVDGSASQDYQRTMIGSTRANGWWKYNSNCVPYIESYKCNLAAGDSSASLIIHHNDTSEGQIGISICANGGGVLPCPVIGQVSHFGSTNETDGLALAVNAKITGPLIAASGGWFIRFAKGTPTTLTLTSAQVANGDVLLLAIPYPAGTAFTIYHQAATWCGSSWAVCRHNFTSVGSVAEVKSGFGDVYYWSASTRTLYLRIVQTPATFGNVGSDKTKWTSYYAYDDSFSRAGQALIVPSYSSSIVIQSSCSTSPCAPQNDVAIPAALPLSTGTATTSTANTASTATTGTKSATSSGAAPTTAANGAASANGGSTSGSNGGSTSGSKSATTTTAAGEPLATTTTGDGGQQIDSEGAFIIPSFILATFIAFVVFA